MNLSKEQRTLVVMRKVLTDIIKEITPKPGQPHPLSQETLDEIRSALGLIVARERELQSEGTNKDRPYFTDQKQKVSFNPIKK